MVVLARQIRFVVTLVLCVVIMAPACAHSSDGSGASMHRVALGTTTSAGLVVQGPVCTYQSGQLTATGVLHVDGAEAGTQIRVTVIVSGSAGGSFSRIAEYPTPSATGTDVPFSIVVDTPNESGASCEIQVDWVT